MICKITTKAGLLTDRVPTQSMKAMAGSLSPSTSLSPTLSRKRERERTNRSATFMITTDFAMPYLLLCLIAFLPACSVGLKPVIAPPAFAFAAYGDMPYRVIAPDGRTDEQVLIQSIAPKIRLREDIPFVIHLGDLGRPEYACTDSWLEQTKAFWENDLVKPVFYTPGDNDWTDCDRSYLLAPTSELERLAVIRKMFFSQPSKLAPAWRYEQQLSLPENQTWWYGNIRFVTQHIVSTDNGRSEIYHDDPEAAIRLVDERDKQNQRWLDHAFEMAKQGDTSAIVVAMQVDPFGAPEGLEDAMSRCLKQPAYQEFCKHLQFLAIALDKPVLVIHGDTGAYCLDQPLPLAPKFWRLNAPGDVDVIDASVVTFDPADAAHPFKETGLLSGRPVPEVCVYSR